MQKTLPPAAAMRKQDSAKGPFLEVCCPTSTNTSTKGFLRELSRAIDDAKRRAEMRGFATDTVILFPENVFKYCFTVKDLQIVKAAEAAWRQLPPDQWIAICFSAFEKNSEGHAVNSGYLVCQEGLQIRPKLALSNLDAALLRIHVGASSRKNDKERDYVKYLAQWYRRRKDAENMATPFCIADAPSGKKIELRICLDACVPSENEIDTVCLVPAEGLSPSVPQSQIMENRMAVIVNDGRLETPGVFTCKPGLKTNIEISQRLNNVALFE